ncbi:hypothetical protein [Clostridium sp. ZBS12]|nr:hypothetical protein [Clostridium sp. ZBS12]
MKIAKVLDSKVEALRKCIQSNFWNLKKEHKITIIQRKEAIKSN